MGKRISGKGILRRWDSPVRYSSAFFGRRRLGTADINAGNRLFVALPSLEDLHRTMAVMGAGDSIRAA